VAVPVGVVVAVAVPVVVAVAVAVAVGWRWRWGGGGRGRGVAVAVAVGWRWSWPWSWRWRYGVVWQAREPGMRQGESARGRTHALRRTMRYVRGACLVLGLVLWGWFGIADPGARALNEHRPPPQPPTQLPPLLGHCPVRANPLLLPPGKHWMAQYVVPELRLIVCPISKVSSTMMSRLVLCLGGEARWREHPYSPHNARTLTQNLTLSRWPLATAASWMRDPSWVRVVVVRDPVERLLSAFRDKIARPSALDSRLVRELAGQLKLPPADLQALPFASFVERLQSVLHHERVDYHIAPQVNNCGLRQWAGAYDHVLRLDGGFTDVMRHLAESVPRLRALHDLSFERAFTAKFHPTNSSGREVRGSCADALARALYAEDVALYAGATPTRPAQ
jgi:hypothetical protein